mmetsp:Transcript_72615/g.200352  ORF Transcript_72615/g.200352 Transcript_72615/m.200352 type:complete len:237 (+) Transcript_72615:1641-2351(+)
MSHFLLMQGELLAAVLAEKGTVQQLPRGEPKLRGHWLLVAPAPLATVLIEPCDQARELLGLASSVVDQDAGLPTKEGLVQAPRGVLVEATEHDPARGPQTPVIELMRVNAENEVLCPSPHKVASLLFLVRRRCRGPSRLSDELLWCEVNLHRVPRLELPRLSSLEKHFHGSLCLCLVRIPIANVVFWVVHREDGWRRLGRVHSFLDQVVIREPEPLRNDPAVGGMRRHDHRAEGLQ